MAVLACDVGGGARRARSRVRQERRRGGISVSLQHVQRGACAAFIGREILAARRAATPVYNRRMSSTATASSTVGLGIDRLLDLDRRWLPVAASAWSAIPRRSTARSGTPRIDWSAIREVTVGAVRPPARIPIRSAGQHDRDTARARRAAARCRCIRCTARRASRRRKCSRDVDVLVVDLQDVGTRVYTYIYTMANCMRAAARHGVRVVVCDRPNPVGGDEIEGAGWIRRYASFVGQFPIPLRHGMTIGELARLFNEEFGINCSLDVVPLEGWRRSMYLRRDRAAVGDAVAEHADARQRDRLPGRGAVRRHEAVRRTRHDAAVRADRRAVDRRRAAGGCDERARAAGRALPCRRSSNRHFRSTRSRPAAAARCTCSIVAAFRPVRTAVEMIAEFRAAGTRADSPGASRRTVRARKQPIDILFGRIGCGRTHRRRRSSELDEPCAKSRGASGRRRVTVRFARPTDICVYRLASI